MIWQYDLSDDGTKLGKASVFADMSYEGKSGFADGIRCDEDGNIWSSAGWVGDGYDGVHIFAPNGDRIGIIEMPEIVANVCFGGERRNLLVHDREPVAVRDLRGDHRGPYHLRAGVILGWALPAATRQTSYA